MTCSIATRQGLEPNLPDLLDIRDSAGNLLCTVFGLQIAERLVPLINDGLLAGKDVYGVVFAALSRLDCELVAKNTIGTEHWWATARDAPRARVDVISALSAQGDSAVPPSVIAAPSRLTAHSTPVAQ